MIIESEFQPHPLLKNPHLQTIIASKCRSTPRLPRLQVERLDLPDGDFVDLAWQLEASGPIVCLFHGLQGSVNSAYAQSLIRRLYENDFRCVFMHFRGCSGEPNRLAKSYHSGQTDDIRQLIEIVNARFPSSDIMAVGFSLGANALLKYLGEDGDRSPVCKAVAISPPLVLAEGATRMNHGFSRVYQHWLVKQMQQAVLRKKCLYPHLDIPDRATSYNTFFEFDDVFTARLNGFADVHDYYRQSSARQFLRHINRDTHIIYAQDDPFFTENCIPLANELSQQVCFELSQFGGHVGFIASKRGVPSYWLDKRIITLLAQR